MGDETLQARCERFAELHRGDLFVIGNVWDAGSARILETLGFEALASTSSGTALRHGLRDYGVTVETVVEDVRAMVEATDLPLSVDFEDGFGADAAEVASSVGALCATGVAGFSVEDYTRNADAPLFDIDVAVERLVAACDVAHGGPAARTVTARTEILTNRAARAAADDPIAAVIERLQRFQEAGADVLFAPGLHKLDDIERVVGAVDKPVSIMAMPGVPPVAELAGVGVKRVSVASFLAVAALEGLRSAAAEVLEHGTFDFMGELQTTFGIIGEAFGPRT